MSPENKQEMIELIETLDTDEVIKKTILDFVKTFDGTNTGEFNTLIFTIVLLISRFEELKVKAEGFDKFISESENYEKLLAELKAEFEELKAGEFPAEPPTTKADTATE